MDEIAALKEYALVIALEGDKLQVHLSQQFVDQLKELLKEQKIDRAIVGMKYGTQLDILEVEITDG
jgi:hypothetical protein